MKKILIIIVLFTVLVTACKTEKKSVIKEETNREKMIYSLFKAQKEVSWTAYKTTEKIPVKGVFKTVKILKNGKGNTIREAVANTKFSIPVSSIFSGNEERDNKLIKMFFGVMNNPELLTGKLSLIDDTNGEAEILMNGVTAKLPFIYTVQENKFQLKAIMDLKNWQTEKSIISLNKACFDLHKGKDGISKTWKDVEISISISF